MGIVGFQGGEVVSDLRFLWSQFCLLGVWLVKCTAWVRGALRDRKRAPDALEWLWAALWVLGATPVSSASPIPALNCWDISPGLSERLWEKPTRVGTSPVEGAITSLTRGWFPGSWSWWAPSPLCSSPSVDLQTQRERACRCQCQQWSYHQTPRRGLGSFGILPSGNWFALGFLRQSGEA